MSSDARKRNTNPPSNTRTDDDMGARPPVAAVVAALNEETTVGSVVQALVASGCFRDVIVVSDGSTDRTAQVAREAGATVVFELPHNRGKGAAMQYGVSRTDAEILFFCDADLLRMTPAHATELLSPVMSGALEMSVGLHDRGRFSTRLTPFLPLISGQRAMKRHIFEDVPDRYMRGYMVESALNYFCRSHKLPYGTVRLPGLSFRRKFQKIGTVRGAAAYVRMCIQVTWAMLAVRIARFQGKF